MRPVANLLGRPTAVRRSATTVIAFLLSAISLSPGESSSHGEGDIVLRDYLSGNGLLNRGLYELAAVEYRKFLSQHGDHDKAAVARYGLGVSLFRLGQANEAVTELAPLLKLAEFDYAAEAWTITGQCYLTSGRNAEAVGAFHTVVERFAKHDLADDAAAGAIEALYADKRYDEALAVCRDFESQWPDSQLRERTTYFRAVSAMGKADYAQASNFFEQLLQTYPQGPFVEQATFLLAQCHQQNNAIDQAIQQYSQVLKQKGGQYLAEALAALGVLLYQQGEYAHAGEALDQLLERYPQSSHLGQARLQRGRVWFELGEYKRAFDTFAQVPGKETASGDEAGYWMAKCQLRLGDAAGAAGRLRNTIEKYPASELGPEMYYDRAVALIRSGDADRAIETLREFHARFTQHALASSALQLLAVTEHQQKQYERSQVHCREFLAQYPANAHTAVILFLSCENDFLSEKYLEAAGCLAKFVEYHQDDPQTPKAKFRWATALYRLQRFDEAEPLLAELAPLANSDDLYLPVLLALGDIYFQHGEWKAAELRLNEYVSAGTDQPALDDALLKLGLARQRQERGEEALLAYDRLIEGFPQSPHRVQALFERGQVLVELKRLDEAAKAFESVVSWSGDSRFASHALHHLAAIAAQRNDPQQSATLYARLAQKSAGAEMEAEAMLQQGRMLMAAQQFSEAEGTFAQFVDRFPAHSNIAEARARWAIALARQDRPAETLAAIEQINADTSKLEPALLTTLKYEKAWCQRALGNLDGAAVTYREVLARPPVGALDLHAMLELAEIEAGAKRFAAAAQVLRRLRDVLATRSSEAPGELVEQCAYRLGVCEFELQRFDESVKLFEEFVATYPKSNLMASASLYCGEALFKTQAYDRAIPHLTRVAKEFGADPAASASLLRLGECQALLQRWTPSERAFVDYLDRFPEGELWYQASFGLGWARENQQRYEEAVAAYQKVVERHPGPTAARAQFQIGQCLFAQQKLDDAIRELLKVDILYAYPEWSAAALYEAARCFEKLGKTTEAKKHFQQVEEKYQQTQWAKLAGQRLSELSSSTSLPGR